MGVVTDQSVWGYICYRYTVVIEEREGIVR